MASEASTAPEGSALALGSSVLGQIGEGSLGASVSQEDVLLAQKAWESVASDGTVLREERLVPGGLAEGAGAVLAAYREGGVWSLVQAGYLDLLGNTWGCVVMEADAVEVCVVSEEEGEDGEARCRCQTYRLEAEQWADQVA